MQYLFHWIIWECGQHHHTSFNVISLNCPNYSWIFIIVSAATEMWIGDSEYGKHSKCRNLQEAVKKSYFFYDRFFMWNLFIIYCALLQKCIIALSFFCLTSVCLCMYLSVCSMVSAMAAKFDAMAAKFKWYNVYHRVVENNSTV